MRRALFFEAPGRIVVRGEPAPDPGPGQVRIKTEFSAISAGTELLVYRGQMPTRMEADPILPALSGELRFPLKYGYACVGRVVELGRGVPADWLDRPVFAFQPHQTEFTASLEEVQPLAEGIDPQAALFLPNVETALNLVQDGGPLAGESVVVLGQGIVGLLTTALLSRFPLIELFVFDKYPLRREAALHLGAKTAGDPASLLGSPEIDADLTFELSGDPAALDLAIAVTGFAGRIVIGSWYGTKRAPIDLGGKFHRSRIRLMSSQVSTIDPALQGRWSKERRFKAAWALIPLLNPQELITQRFPFEAGAQAYEMLDRHPEQTIQVILDYRTG